MRRAAQIRVCVALGLWVAGCATTRYEEFGPPQEDSPSESPHPSETVPLQTLVALEERIERLEIELAGRLSELETANDDLATRMMSLVEQMEAVRNQLQALQQGSKPVRTESKADPKGLYERGLEDFYAQGYREAKAGFQKVLALDAQGELADNAQYWIGECDYALKDYALALEAFHKVFEYSKTEKDDDAQYKLGLCYWKLGNYENALIELKRFTVDYPESEYFGRTEELIRKIRARLGP